MSRALKTLLDEIAVCRICEAVLPLGPRPVLAASAHSRVLIAGQAPGTKVHASGVPWDDASGDTLRAWLQVERTTFYDTAHFAIVPMGFCYPGKGKSGDLPPRAECAATWHHQLMPRLRGLSLRLVIGDYAQRYHLGAEYRGSVTENVRSWRQMPADVIPLPHPSPRNRPCVAGDAPLLRGRAAARASRSSAGRAQCLTDPVRRRLGLGRLREIGGIRQVLRASPDQEITFVAATNAGMFLPGELAPLFAEDLWDDLAAAAGLVP